MSFILDALKKSESDRQRQNGPALFEVKVAPPRTRLPLWALAIGALLIVNLGIVMWLLLRHPAHAATEAANAASPLSPAAAPLAPAATGPVPIAAPAVSAAAPPATNATTPPAAVAAPPAAAPASATAVPPETPAPTASSAALQRAADNAPPAPGTAAPEGGNPADYAPAEEPAAAGAAGHVKRGTAAGVPLYQDAAAVPGMQIPQLRLDLHVFAARPEDRFVMINMHKVHEGDTLPEGVHVDSITPEGAVLSYNGSHFLLPRE
jgi:general secretion pathway protein B